MKRIVMAMTAIAAFANPALADVETFTHTTPTGTNPFTDNFTLSGFNPNLGTLNSIELILSTNSTAQVNVVNYSNSNGSPGTPEPFTNANASIPITLTGPAGVTTSQILVAGPFAGTASVGQNVYSGITGTATTTAYVPTADFASYQAPSSRPNLAFDVTGANGNYNGSGVDVAFGGSATVGGTTEIIYTFTNAAPPPTPPVPEPTTLTILGLGMAALGMVRRRQG